MNVKAIGLCLLVVILGLGCRSASISPAREYSSEVKKAQDDLRKIRVKNFAGVLAGQLYSAGFDAEESELGEDRVTLNVKGKVSTGKLAAMVCLPTYKAKDGTIDFRNTRRHLVNNGIKSVTLRSKQDSTEIHLGDGRECIGVTSHP